MPKNTNILVAQNHQLVREALEYFIKNSTVFKVVGTTANGKETLTLLKQVHIDIILLDVEMEVMNGKETLLKINKRFPDTKVIMLSRHKDPALKIEFIRSGAKAFVSTQDPFLTLIEAITTVDEKGVWLGDDLAELLINASGMHSFNSLKNNSLTNRELEVLDYLCEGLSDKKIAEKLNVSYHTAHGHRKSIFSKTNSHNVAELMRFVYKK